MLDQDHPKPRSHWHVSLMAGMVSSINTLLPLVLVRLLSPDDIGNFRIFFLYITALPTLFLTSGFMNGVAFWSGQGSEGRAALKLTGQLTLLIGILAAALIGLVGFSMSSLFHWDQTLLMLFALASFGAIAGFYFEEATISTGNSWTGAIYFSASELMRTTAIVCAAFIWRDLTAVIIAHTCIVILKTLLGFVLAHQYQLFDLHFKGKLLKKVLRYAVPVSCAGILSLLINQVDKLILSTWLTGAEFARYSIGCLALGPLIMVEHSITRVLIPQLAELVSQNKLSSAARIYSNAVRQLALLFIPATIGLITFADPLITLLFTDSYAESANYLRIFALWYLFFIIPFDAIARAYGDSTWPLKTFGKISLISVPITLVATYYFGAYGALTAMLFAAGSLRLATLRYSLAKTSWSLNCLLPFKPIVAIFLFSILGSLIALALKPIFLSQIYWLLTIGSLGLIALVIFAILVENTFRIRDQQVLVLVQSLQTGGIERLAVQISQALHTQQLLKQLVAYDHSGKTPLQAEAQAAGLDLHLREKGPGFSVAFVCWLAIQSYMQNISIIHTHDLGGLIYASLARILALNRFKIVHTQHSFIHLEHQPKYKIYEWIFSHCASSITVVAPALIKTYKDLGINEKKIQVIGNGAAFPESPNLGVSKYNLRSRLKPEISAPLDAIWILYLARLYPQKGHVQALSVWSLLPETIRRRCCLLLVGPEAQANYRDQLTELISETPDNQRIFLPGGTAQPLEWIQACDVFLSTSESEGQPLSCIEALGCGITCVLSDIEGHQFIRQQATLVPLEDLATASSILLRILEQLPLSAEQALERWQTAQEFRDKFSLESMSQKYLTLFKSLH